MAAEAPQVRPIAYSSRRLRIIVAVFALCLVGLSFLFWVGLPPSLKAAFTLSQAVTLLIILGGFVLGLIVLGSAVVKADADGISFRNGLSRHWYPWDRVHRFVLGPGDPWAHVLLVPTDRAFAEELDAERRMLMGIQAGDGPSAEAAVEDLNRRLREYRASQ
ncbi:MAG: PH domain-containing protein [Microlunatus sp.]|nr:PH domain-containing protein [Microlunatus sp.]MDN5770225.1 PH domain-containing protein [Microlunatus sp.]MDN5804303.1 PH domain-containing protein [Microlunatus sp.]